MEYVIKEICIPEEPNLNEEDLLDAAYNMAEKEKQYFENKLGKDYNYIQRGLTIRKKCPAPSCRAKTLMLISESTTANYKKRIMHYECLNCDSTIWEYAELEEKK